MHSEFFWLSEPLPSWTEALTSLSSRAAGTTTGNTALAEPAIPATEAWSQLVELAGYRPDGLATIRLDRRLTGLFGKAPPPGLPHCVRLAVLASAMAEHLLPAIRIAALRRGMWLQTYISGYGQSAQELLDSSSPLHAFRPDAVLFVLDAEGADLVALDDHVARDGLTAWHDPVLWHRAKEEVSPAAVPTNPSVR